MTSNNIESNFLDDLSVSFSSLTCPYTNLAIENELLDGNFESNNHLFLYRNEPCIVMGRFQVPWREINIPKLLNSSMNLKVVRRRSGGGSVYHDLGNWNYCFIHKQRELPRERNLDLMIHLLRSIGIYVQANERYDLVYQQSKEEVFKVSGAAFKQKKDTSLHHGTLLMDAALSSLKGHLGHPKNWEIDGKGVMSHPSAVINLAQVFGPISFESWIENIEKELNKKGFVWQLDNLNKAIEQERDELKSWSWCWAETPEFSVSLPISMDVQYPQYFFSHWVKGQCRRAEIQAGTKVLTLKALIGKSLGPREELESIYQEVQESLGDVSGLCEALSYFFFK